MNSVDSSRNWEGIKIDKGEEVEIKFLTLINCEEMGHERNSTLKVS